MANKKISELGVLSTVAGADFLAVVDDTDSTTKQLTVTNLMAAKLATVQTADIYRQCLQHGVSCGSNLRAL